MTSCRCRKQSLTFVADSVRFWPSHSCSAIVQFHTVTHVKRCFKSGVSFFKYSWSNTCSWCDVNTKPRLCCRTHPDAGVSRFTFCSLLVLNRTAWRIQCVWGWRPTFWNKAAAKSLFSVNVLLQNLQKCIEQNRAGISWYCKCTIKEGLKTPPRLHISIRMISFWADWCLKVQ